MAKPVLVVFVLDESGSMGSIRDRTISSFNEYVDGLRPKGKMCHFSLTKFNSGNTKAVCVDVPVKDALKLDEGNYLPNASTPLLDAVGDAIGKTDEVIKNSKTKPDVLFVVLTDGEENDSRRFTRQQIVDFIKERETSGWTFVYLGANQDAWENASSLGYSNVNNTQVFRATNDGILDGVAVASAATTRYFGRRDAYYAAFVGNDAVRSASFADTNFLSNAAGEESLDERVAEFTANVLKKEKKSK